MQEESDVADKAMVRQCPLNWHHHGESTNIDSARFVAAADNGIPISSGMKQNMTALNNCYKEC
jgi:hypothetical protein